jgi:hypothetical protein
MEQNNLTAAQLWDSVQDGRKQHGTYQSEDEKIQLALITRKLSETSPFAPYYQDIQFLLHVANKNTQAVEKLEKQVDQLVFENIKTRLKVDRVDSQTACFLAYPRGV